MSTTFAATASIPHILMLLVYDEISVSEEYGATSCLFVIIENVSVGYQYAGGKSIDERVYRAFDILFDETIRHMEPGIGRLFSIDN